MKRLSIPLVILFGALFLGACGATDSTAEGGSSGSVNGGAGEEISTPDGTFTRVSPDALKAAMEGEDIVLVNTHVPFAGDIPGTDLSIPFDEIGQNLDRLPGKDARIALYCLGGPMSDEASRTLVRLGYTNVWDLDGGMEAWRASGFQIDGA